MYVHTNNGIIMAMQDGNMGLVKLVLAGRTKRAIQRLTQTFLTLSLADIAQQVGLETAAEAEGHILRYWLLFRQGAHSAEVIAAVNMRTALLALAALIPGTCTLCSSLDHVTMAIKGCFMM